MQQECKDDFYGAIDAAIASLRGTFDEKEFPLGKTVEEIMLDSFKKRNVFIDHLRNDHLNKESHTTQLGDLPIEEIESPLVQEHPPSQRSKLHHASH